MVNYACAFSQSELGTYFEWIITGLNIRVQSLKIFWLDINRVKRQSPQKRSTRFRTRQNFCLVFLSSILLSILITKLQFDWENCLFYCHSQHFNAGRPLAAKICKFQCLLRKQNARINASKSAENSPMWHLSQRDLRLPLKSILNGVKNCPGIFHFCSVFNPVWG